MACQLCAQFPVRFLELHAPRHKRSVRGQEAMKCQEPTSQRHPASARCVWPGQSGAAAALQRYSSPAPACAPEPVSHNSPTSHPAPAGTVEIDTTGILYKRMERASWNVGSHACASTHCKWRESKDLLGRTKLSVSDSVRMKTALFLVSFVSEKPEPNPPLSLTCARRAPQ